MATGDVQGNLERLRVQLRTIAYPHALHFASLKEGSPAAFLPLLHYALLGYSRHVSRFLSENGYELFAKSDLRFVEYTLKFLREEFGYRCPLTVAQIFSRGFAERKFIFVHDVIQICKRKHNDLIKVARQAQPTKKMKGDYGTAKLELPNIDVDKLNAQKREEDQERTKGNERMGINSSKFDLSMETERDAHNAYLVAKGPFYNEIHESNISDTPQQEQMEACNNHAVNIPHASKGADTSFDENKARNQSDPEIDRDRPKPEDPETVDHPCQSHHLLNHCYEKLRKQIIEVAGSLDKQLLSLEGHVQRTSTNMQNKLIFLERQMHLLEKMYIGRRVTPRYENFQSKMNDGSVLSLDCTRNMLQMQQRLSTQELIARIEARCNKTREMLLDGGWASA